MTFTKTIWTNTGLYRRQILAIYGLVWISICLFSCSKDLGDCLKGQGKTREEIRLTSPFTSVRLEDNIDLVLVRDSICMVRISAGEGIIGDILTEVRDGWLKIRNINHCNWVRKLNPAITAMVHYISLDTLNYAGVGNVSTLDTIRAGTFTLEIRDGAGSICLLLVADTAFINEHDGTSDIHLAGRADRQYAFINGYGPLMAYDFQTNFTYIHSLRTNDCYIRARQQVEARIEASGNVYCKGNPWHIVTWITGSGQLFLLP
ncbi:MAG TPA: DUF2807 domain-containing protein [Bacteroidales bacterium]|nr:DUF2807 domain-containing protein [Bacteroidales bacterium]HSA43918.1 DUF2807 domain-containing protein [Bacteroidales bacterium]